MMPGKPPVRVELPVFLTDTVALLELCVQMLLKLSVLGLKLMIRANAVDVNSSATRSEGSSGRMQSCWMVVVMM
jgi:hypothetical protein